MANEELQRLLLQRMDSQADDLKEIKAQVKLTNGEVTKLKLWRARVEGSQAAVGGLGQAALAVFASSIGGIVVYLLSH